MENRGTKRMGQTALALLIAGAVVMTGPISAWAKHLGGETGHPSSASRKAEDVRNTMHNLSSSNPINGVNIGSTATGTTEVCVFCHTPHGADVSNQAAPLWNRQLPVSTSYTTYNSANFDADDSGGPKGVSLACLSCHDGTTALDAYINGPGSGGYRGLTPSSAGSIQDGVTSDFLTAGNLMSGTTRGPGGEKNYQAMTGAAPFPNLTVKLSDDHPISFPMQTLGSIDPQFDDVTVSDAGSVSLIANTAAGKTNTPTDRRDRLRLYPPSGGTVNLVTKQDWVECASCHNPHAPRPLFLRLPLSATAYTTKGGGALTVNEVLGAAAGGGLIADDPNAGSAVCLSCHEK
jgi:hypothetical protein